MKPPQFDAVLGHFRPLEIPAPKYPHCCRPIRNLIFNNSTSKEKKSLLVSLGTDVAQVLGIVLNLTYSGNKSDKMN